jgi:peptidoglycan/LPS O-acetylase OafA/YrhL
MIPDNERSVKSRAQSNRIPILDGWRAISIILVLAAHLLPLGPKWLRINEQAGAMGMGLFFCLSGFLIVGFLSAGAPIGTFLLKRVARIVPLAWIAIGILSIADTPKPETILRNLSFVANIPPLSLLRGGEHLWSLGVEVQFYLVAALIVLLLGRRGLLLVPVMALAITCLRIAFGQTISIVTWFRVDEILAGGIIALAYQGRLGDRIERLLENTPVWIPFIAFLVASHPTSGALQYFRPYATALLVGSSLARAPVVLRRFLESRQMAYVAEISYALYVIHGVLMGSWLGSGDRLEKYLKRPLLLTATVALAHCSTRYLEQPITSAVRRRRQILRPTRTPDKEPPDS